MLAKVALVALPLVCTLVACGSDPATSPLTPPDRPQLSGGTCGGYTPSTGYILVDSIVLFVRDSASIVNCGTTYGVITPGNGVAGFEQGSACANTARDGGKIKYGVRGCTTGNVDLKIYNDSTQTTLLQTIPITVDLP